MDVESHDALLCVLTGKLISDEKRLRYTGTEYIKSENEMLELFKDHIDDETIKEAVNNTVEISQKMKYLICLVHIECQNSPLMKTMIFLY